MTLFQPVRVSIFLTICGVMPFYSSLVLRQTSSPLFFPWDRRNRRLISSFRLLGLNSYDRRTCRQSITTEGVGVRVYSVGGRRGWGGGAVAGRKIGRLKIWLVFKDAVAPAMATPNERWQPFWQANIWWQTNRQFRIATGGVRYLLPENFIRAFAFLG